MVGPRPRGRQVPWTGQGRVEKTHVFCDRRGPMALPSTLHHFDVALSHVDRGLDLKLAVKAARHPSETIERLWLRLLAFCWQWEETIAFGPGICEPDGAGAAGARAGRVDPDAAGPRRPARGLPGREGPGPGRRRPGGGALRGRAAARVLPRRGPRRASGAAGQGRAGRGAGHAPSPLAQRDERRQKVGLTIVADHLYLDLGRGVGRRPAGPGHRLARSGAEPGRRFLVTAGSIPIRSGGIWTFSVHDAA